MQHLRQGPAALSLHSQVSLLLNSFMPSSSGAVTRGEKPRQATGTVFSISLILATLLALSWRCRLVAIGILFLVVESTPVSLSVAQFRFAAGALALFCGAPVCSVTRTGYAFPGPAGGPNRAVRLRFHV